MNRRLRLAVVALSTSALITTGTAIAPVQAQMAIEVPAPAFTTEMLSSVLPQQLQEFLYLAVALPVIASSVLSSVIGIPQCGLHDTRAC